MMASVFNPVVLALLLTVSSVCGIDYMVGFMDLGIRDKKQIIQSHALISSYKKSTVKMSMVDYKREVKIPAKKYFKFVMDPLEERATKSDCTEKKGLLIQSEQEICVHGISFDHNSLGGFYTYPLTNYSKEFYIPTYDTARYFNSQFLIASNSDNNKVRISFKRKEGYEKRKYVTIDKYDLYQMRGWAKDYTGTYIVSEKPVAVFAGVDCARVPVTVGWCDHMMAGVPPVSQLGKRYIVGPLAERANYTGYIVRVVSTRDNTLVTVDSQGDTMDQNKTLALSNNRTLGRGEFWDINTNDSSLIMDIRCHYSCMVVQYGKGKQWDHKPWDPFMMVVTPVSRYANEMMWTNPVDRYGMSTYSYANIVVPYGFEDGVLLDNKNITTNWTVSPNGDFSFAKVKKFQGVHHVRHINDTVELGVMNYGRGGTEATAFGYPACAVQKASKNDEPSAASSRACPGDNLRPLWFVLGVIGGFILGLLLAALYVWMKVRNLRGVPAYIFCPGSTTGVYHVKPKK